MVLRKGIIVMVCLLLVIMCTGSYSAVGEARVNYGPQVIASTPTALERNAPIESAIELIFDQEIIESTHYQLITLVSSSTQTTIVLTKEIEQDKLTLTPEQPLAVDESYMLFVPVGAVQSLDETIMRETYALEFGTFADEAAEKETQNREEIDFLEKSWQAEQPELLQAEQQSLSSTMSLLQVPFVSLPVAQVLTGGNHSGFVTENGMLLSWGVNTSGQLGIGTLSNQYSPQGVARKIAPIVQIAGGGARSYALDVTSAVWGWGQNFIGILGGGALGTMTVSSPVPIVKQDGSALDGIQFIEAGSGHTLAIDEYKKVWSWGFNNYGELGNGGSIEHMENHAVQVKNSTGNGYLSHIEHVSAGGSHSVASDYFGNVWSWGLNDRGQLGDGSITSHALPVQVKQANGTALGQVISVSAGYDFTVALKSDGTVWSWGRNNYGQLGNGTNVDSLYPVQVKGANGTGELSNIIAISSGAAHVLALKKDGTVWSWGNNDYGQLGNQQLLSSNVPVQVHSAGGNGVLQQVQQIGAGDYHNVVIRYENEVYTWGKNHYGQAGNIVSNPMPVTWEITVKVVKADYTYDANGRAVKVVYTVQNNAFDRVEQQFQYDANGNLINTNVTILGW